MPDNHPETMTACQSEFRQAGVTLVFLSVSGAETGVPMRMMMGRSRPSTGILALACTRVDANLERFSSPTNSSFGINLDAEIDSESRFFKG